MNDSLVFPMAVKVNWDRNPVSVHSVDSEPLNHCINYLRNRHGIRKHSVVMPDRIEGGYIFFLYEACDPKWFAEFNSRGE